MTEKDSENVDSKIARHIGTFVGSIQHKLDLIVEGQQMLSEKIDRSNTDLAQRIDCVEHKLDSVAAETQGNTEAIRGLDTRLDTIEIKLDAVAADLSAHRADTETHRKVYKIKED